jgi:hypothetical protein
MTACQGVSDWLTVQHYPGGTRPRTEKMPFLGLLHGDRPGSDTRNSSACSHGQGVGTGFVLSPAVPHLGPPKMTGLWVNCEMSLQNRHNMDEASHVERRDVPRADGAAPARLQYARAAM